MVSTRQSSNSSGNITANDGLAELSKSYDSSANRRSQQAGQPGPSHATSLPVSQMHLLDLPLEVLQKILGYLDFNTIAHLRPVCHQMDRVCGSMLNSTFQKLQTQMHNRFQSIKAQMPRRESARRNHPLACESDIIETLHMRLTLLQMSFGKHIERKHCCFFPGEILDEVYRILHYIKVTPKLARPYKVTDELFDLSTMAMEYFKDCIEPTLPEIPYFGADFLDLGVSFSSSSSVSKYSLCLDTAPLSVGDSKSRGENSPARSTHEDSSMVLDSSAPPASPPQLNMVLRKRIRKIKQGMKRYSSQLTLMRRDLRSCKAKIAEQQKQLSEYSTRMDENDKKNEETSRKFSTLLQELNKCKTELQYWRSKSPAIPVCFGCGQSMPLPPEDIQALTNQGIPIVEANIDDQIDFVPINEESYRSPTNNEIDNVEIIQFPQQQTTQSTQQSNQSDSNNCPDHEAMAPPKVSSSAHSNIYRYRDIQINHLPNIPTKRKSTSSSHDDCSVSGESARKLRRTIKSRQAKRSKM